MKHNLVFYEAPKPALKKIKNAKISELTKEIQNIKTKKK